ncbi:hypothetical protein D3C83_48960 [compost metagenome]
MRSVLSLEPESTNPLAMVLHPFTQSVWPRSVAMLRPVATSHTCSDLSADAETSCSGCGPNAQPRTEFVWPASTR